MAKSKTKTNDENCDPTKVPTISWPQARPMPLPAPVIERDQLFDLYLARVAKSETVNTMRRDARAIFRDAFFEAKCALEVYRELTEKE